MLLQVKDYIKCNDNIDIQISGIKNPDGIGIGDRVLYKGLLYDVPEVLREVPVVQCGFLLAAEINQLTVMLCEVPVVYLNYIDGRKA